MSEVYIPEAILAGQPKELSAEETEIILKYLKESICKIKCDDGKNGTGFFCNINNWESNIKVLITNNHVLNEEDILYGKKIKFSMNDDLISFVITLDESRKLYTDKNYDVTFIEIKKEDGLKKESFLDIDPEIFNDNPNELFRNKSILLLHYPKGTKMHFSQGSIKCINEDDFYNIRHLCNSSGGSSGGPLINALNFRIIGIHKGAPSDGKNYNLGTFLKGPINDFINKIKNNENKLGIKKEKVDIKNIEDNIENDLHTKENEKIENNQNFKIDYIDEIAIQYKIDKIKYSKDIQIFGDKFVENNKNLCRIIFNGNEYDLCSKININNKQLSNNIFEIKLKGINNIKDMRYMFNDCESLSYLPDISKWNTSQVTNMSYMFYNCKSLSSLPDISKWNTTNVSYMRGMFSGCKSLSSLPDISKWNTTNLKNIGGYFDADGMFCDCESLSSLPDISKWNTTNVSIMNEMFHGCKSLSSLPDISKWDTSNVTDMTDMFCECSLLSSLPDNSKWDTSNVTNMSGMFNACESLSSLPDISKWNTSNVTDMSYMFYGSSSLLSSLHNISKWNTNNVTDMKGMFSGCSSLPDISKWNTNNANNMNWIFSGCSSLTSLPNISK